MKQIDPKLIGDYLRTINLETLSPEEIERLKNLLKILGPKVGFEIPSIQGEEISSDQLLGFKESLEKFLRLKSFTDILIQSRGEGSAMIDILFSVVEIEEQKSIITVDDKKREMLIVQLVGFLRPLRILDDNLPNYYFSNRAEICALFDRVIQLKLPIFELFPEAWHERIRFMQSLSTKNE